MIPMMTPQTIALLHPWTPSTELSQTNSIFEAPTEVREELKCQRLQQAACLQQQLTIVFSLLQLRPQA
jgi:hypothetical protein